MKFIFLLNILFGSIFSFAQTNEMVENDNQIDSEFKPNKEIFKKIGLNSKSNDRFALFVEKTKDSVFTIYVLNNSKLSAEISTQDWHLFLIQEAKDKDGIWKPIEFWKNSWCGNSYLSQSISPDGILKTESKSYGGTFETEIRFKWRNDGKIYYSNPIMGKIELSQFAITEYVKSKSSFYNYENIVGEEIALKMIFLDPNYNKLYIERLKQQNAERAERLKRKK